MQTQFDWNFIKLKILYRVQRYKKIKKNVYSGATIASDKKRLWNSKIKNGSAI